MSKHAWADIQVSSQHHENKYVRIIILFWSKVTNADISIINFFMIIINLWLFMIIIIIYDHKYHYYWSIFNFYTPINRNMSTISKLTYTLFIVVS